MRQKAGGQKTSQTNGMKGIAQLSIAAWFGTSGWFCGMAIAPFSLVALSLVAPAQAADLSSWTFDPATHQLAITVPSGATPRFFLIAEPARIVLEIPNAEVGSVSPQQAYASGAVRQIRASQFQTASASQPSVSRIVLEMAPDAVFAPGQAELKQVSSDITGDRWVLRPLLAGETPTPIAGLSASPAPVAASVPRLISTPSMNFPQGTAIAALPDQTLPSADLAQATGDRPTLPATINVPSLETLPRLDPQPASGSNPASETPQAAPSPEPTPQAVPPAAPPNTPSAPSPIAPSGVPVNVSPASPPPASNIIEFGQPLPL